MVLRPLCVGLVWSVGIGLTASKGVHVTRASIGAVFFGICCLMCFVAKKNFFFKYILFDLTISHHNISELQAGGYCRMFELAKLIGKKCVQNVWQCWYRQVPRPVGRR